MDAPQERLPCTLPFSVVLPYDALEGGDRRSLVDGDGAWILLRGLLLVADAAATCGRRYEPFVDGYDHRVSANREDLSGQPLDSADVGSAPRGLGSLDVRPRAIPEMIGDLSAIIIVGSRTRVAPSGELATEQLLDSG